MTARRRRLEEIENEFLAIVPNNVIIGIVPDDLLRYILSTTKPYEGDYLY